MADELTMRELANLFEHKLADARDDIVDLKVRLDTALAQQREQFERYVLSAVYEADKRTAAALERAQDERIRRVEYEAETDRQTARTNEHASKQTARVAIFTALGTFLAALALEGFNAWAKSGGH